MARQLAAQRRTSATGAVRDALREALERADSERGGMAQRLLDIGKRSAARSEPFLCDDDLYTEEGLPR